MSDMLRVATHEAAHAVLAVRAGLPIKYATVRPRTRDVRSLMVVDRRALARRRLRFRLYTDLVHMLFAGGVAERCPGRQPARGVSADLPQARTLIADQANDIAIDELAPPRPPVDLPDYRVHLSEYSLAYHLARRRYKVLRNQAVRRFTRRRRQIARELMRLLRRETEVLVERNRAAILSVGRGAARAQDPQRRRSQTDHRAGGSRLGRVEPIRGAVSIG